MNILILSQYFYPENFRINDLSVALQSSEHQVTVITGIPNYPAGKFYTGYGILSPFRETYKNVTIFRVPVFPRGNGRSLSLILNYLSFVFFASLVGSIILAFRKYELCLVWNTSPITSYFPAILFKKIFKKPNIIWVQDLWPETFKAVTGIDWPITNIILEKMVRWVYSDCDQIWVQSQGFVKSVESRCEQGKPIEIVPNWADEIFESSQNLKSERFELPENSLIFAGNLGRVQNLECILDAAELVKTQPLHWVFMGSGSLESWLREQIKIRGLGSNVTFLPFMPPEKAIPIIRTAMGILITLKKDPLFALTVPSKLQASWPLMIPIVAAIDGEAARLILESQSGFVGPAGDSQTLAENAVKLLKLNIDQRRALGLNGQNYYQAHFSRTRVLQKIMGILRKARS